MLFCILNRRTTIRRLRFLIPVVAPLCGHRQGHWALRAIVSRHLCSSKVGEIIGEKASTIGVKEADVYIKELVQDVSLRSAPLREGHTNTLDFMM